MITRRNLIAALPALAMLDGALAAAGEPVMESRVFDWNSIPAKATKYGSVRSFFSSPTPPLENLELHVTTLNPGQSPHPPHHHPNEELIIIRQGTVETLSNGKWQRVGPGSVIFNASNQLHGLKNVGPDEAIYHVINWKSSATPSA